ncbi:hypothetical protein KNN17_16530 [Arthrobacter bambusae]|uniref:TY-Chap2 family putative peptide chaperone n=1 Tax=Arthrobacter bambusae TaxID=1338426 RepID=UPI001F50F6C0|nr:hypothetical protein [Arthrobacter bambusae]MCI0143173.1 hypothetical protein [Arthrobacter bambusae]
MCLDTWIPLKSLDDDLLTLEAAALLSLAAKHRTDEVNAAVEIWNAGQYGMRVEIEVSREVTKAREVLRELLKVTGLMLPSAVNRACLTSFNDALREMSSIVDGSHGNSYGVRAAVGLLNLACEDSLIPDQGISELFCSGLLDKAWRDVERFVDLPVFNVRGIQPPELRTPGSSQWNADGQALLGDHPPWTWGIGPMFQTLGGWDTAWLMSPGIFESEQSDRARYWTPLAHLALGPLGWSDPALGVARWILMGMPETTPELSLLARVWGSNALMYFSHPQMDWIPHSHECLGFQPRTSGHKISGIFGERESALAFSGCGGLHVQVHLEWQMCRQQGREDNRASVYVDVTDRRKAVPVLDAMAGWHTKLRCAGDELVDELADPRLEVTVIAPPVGVLGAFKRSLLTGLWYSGSHEAHLLGHCKLSNPIRRVPTTSGPAPTRPVRQGLSDRHTNAAAFWIASELARRHPHYVLHSPEGDEGLQLVSASGQTINISRHATVHVGNTEIADSAEMFATDDKRKFVEDLETKLGLPVKKHAAVSTERTVMYRAMAHVMAVTVGDKATWDFVSADPKTAGAWHLTRDAKPVAFLNPDGTILLPQGPVNLLERYNAHSRRMTPMIGQVFGAILP